MVKRKRRNKDYTKKDITTNEYRPINVERVDNILKEVTRATCALNTVHAKLVSLSLDLKSLLNK